VECRLHLSTPGSRQVPAAVSVSVQRARAAAEMLEGESKGGAPAKKVDDEKWHVADRRRLSDRIEHVKPVVIPRRQGSTFKWLGAPGETAEYRVQRRWTSAFERRESPVSKMKLSAGCAIVAERIYPGYRPVFLIFLIFSPKRRRCLSLRQIYPSDKIAAAATRSGNNSSWKL